MEKNKTGKYLKYAIGEIVLVVIGILIALSINNWNETRKDRGTERYLLNQMLLEMNEDVKTLNQEKEKISSQLPLIKNLVVALGNESVEAPTFNKAVMDYLDGVWYVLRFSSNSATFDEIKSSGKLGIIMNKELRNGIVSLYRNLDNSENMFRSNNEFLTPHAIDLSFYKGMAPFLKDQKEMFSQFNNPDQLYLKKKYKDDFINNAANQHWTITEILPAIDAQVAEIEMIQNKIEMYLKQ